jgi:Ca2+-binding RTX toxin-like protein
MIRTAVVLALVATSGASLADGIQGNGGDNRLVGTDDKDNISGGDIFGKGNRERLFGDAGADDVYGGNGGDRIQGGLSGDELFGQTGNDFVNAIDLQPNDFVDCGEGEFGIAGIDGFFGGSDQIAPNCEALYVGIPISDGIIIPLGRKARSGSDTDLSAIDDAREEVEQAETDGLLIQIS